MPKQKKIRILRFPVTRGNNEVSSNAKSADPMVYKIIYVSLYIYICLCI